MSFRTRRILFSTPFYMFFYFFLLKYLLLLFGGLDNWYVLSITIILGLLHFLPMLFEEKKSRILTRFIASLYGFWQWCSVMYLIEIIAIYIVGIFIDIPTNILIVLIAIVPLLGVYAYCHEHQIKVKEHVLKFDNIKEELNIVHLSDVHYGSLIHDGVLNNLAENLKELSKHCDLAIISGDLADGSCVIEEDSFMPLKDIGMPIIFTPGNHDFYPGIENVCKACENAGIIVLDNDKMEFKGLNIFGFTYSFSELPPVSKDTLIDAIDSNGVNIMIYHVPENWGVFSKLGFNLQLSGHTHGGQFQPAVFFANRLFGYNMGLFKDVSTSRTNYLSVTTGVGVMDYPVRLGTDSELVVLKLRKN